MVRMTATTILTTNRDKDRTKETIETMEMEINVTVQAIKDSKIIVSTTSIREAESMDRPITTTSTMVINLVNRDLEVAETLIKMTTTSDPVSSNISRIQTASNKQTMTIDRHQLSADECHLQPYIDPVMVVKWWASNSLIWCRELFLKSIAELVSMMDRACVKHQIAFTTSSSIRERFTTT